jgi:hypothetical protein
MPKKLTIVTDSEGDECLHIDGFEIPAVGDRDWN